MGCHCLLCYISEDIDISPSYLDSSLCVIQPSISHNVLACKLKKQGDHNIALMYSCLYLEPVCCSMSSSNCCFFSCIQVSQEATWLVWYSHLFRYSTVCFDPHSQRFSVANEAEVDFFFFLEFPCFFYDPTYVGHLISGSSAFSKSSLYIWKFLI